MDSNTELNSIEQKVLEFFLAKRRGSTPESGIGLNGIIVSSRDYSGVGFMTELDRSETLRVGSQTESYTWGDIGGKLNSSLESGYLVFVEKGHVSAIEGFVYGEAEWPQKIEEIEIYPYDGTTYT